MNLQEVVNKASKNLRWQYDYGAGLQLYGDVPDPATNHVEHKLRPGTQQIFTLVSGYRDGSYCSNPIPQDHKDIRVMFGYEKWVQFAPKGWDEMQKANAALMTHAAKVLPDLVESAKPIAREIDSMITSLLTSNNSNRPNIDAGLAQGWLNILRPLQAAIARAEEVS
jgi:hypothetical protein